MQTQDDIAVAADGFIRTGKQPSTTTFTRSPLKCLKTLMSQIRKDGQKIDKTHLNMILFLFGELLIARDFHDRNDARNHDTELSGKPFDH